jgi:hypothetical protein
MKKIIFLFAPVIVFAASCHTTPKDDTDASAPSIVSALQQNEGDAQKRADELKKLTPISTDVLKSFFPQSVMGINRSSFEVANPLGYAIGNAEYKKDDTTTYTIAVYDCAGQAGASFYSISFLTKMSVEKEDDNGYTKSVDFMGAKSLEEFEKNNKKYTESFIYADRFWVVIEGRNTGLDNVKSFAQAIDLDKLKDLK